MRERERAREKRERKREREREREKRERERERERKRRRERVDMFSITFIEVVNQCYDSGYTIYIYIYIYICIFRQHFFVNANFIKHNRHKMSTYFLLDPFKFPILEHQNN